MTVEISKDEAIAAVRAAAWTEEPRPEDATCGHRGCLDHPGEGRRLIHTISGFGMDIPIEDVIGEIEQARKVGWERWLLGHDLKALTEDGKIHRYEVPMPAGVAEKAEARR